MTQLGSCRLRELRADGKPIFVVDGLFDEAFIHMLHPQMARLPFTLSDYDTEATRGVLHWKYEFQQGRNPALPLLDALMKELIEKVGTTSEALLAPREIKLRRMHCNMHCYGDFQSPHTDLPGGATALYFANPRWESDWMGELVFYEDGEPLYAVAPKPGRLVIFDAEILHRGGVPSRFCPQGRISMALKFEASDT
jgi:Rps23 Pro-64 3,4-dihydroxylase Tpa1-like proline 4-hydroxylase